VRASPFSFMPVCDPADGAKVNSRLEKPLSGILARIMLNGRNEFMKSKFFAKMGSSLFGGTTAMLEHPMSALAESEPASSTKYMNKSFPMSIPDPSDMPLTRSRKNWNPDNVGLLIQAERSLPTNTITFFGTNFGFTVSNSGESKSAFQALFMLFLRLTPC